ncbi:MAG: type II secretion system F family protein [Eubacteriales bacterium]|nr:type II secretion system F family protein [Eubacteriales bacterium]
MKMNGNQVKKDIFNRCEKISEKLTLCFPDWITGKSEVMQHKYFRRYGARDSHRLIQQSKAHIMAAYLGIIAIFLMISASLFLVQFTKTEEIRTILRPEQGQAAKSIPVEVQMKYKDYELSENVTIKVSHKELTDTEKLELLRVFERRLGVFILGENKDLSHISKPLRLLDRDSDTGITIRWTSNCPELVREDGSVNILNADGTETIELQAELALDDQSITRIYKAKIDPDAAAEDYERNMTERLTERLVQLSEGRDSSDINLPEELGDGIAVRWFTGRDRSGAILVPVSFLAILTVYFKRYDHINKEIREAEASITKDLPEFINKLVLLLNAGLVVSTAFSKIVQDYEAFHKTGKNQKQWGERFLYEELSEIQKRVAQSNASLIRELQEFSQRCGVREMIRLTAVITDNWNKGSTLAEKLEGESELLWINRKKRAEEKGRLAETKLSFPLMILLMVLIMVTIAPAMMEM